jgi:hypothetical protein
MAVTVTNDDSDSCRAECESVDSLLARAMSAQLEVYAVGARLVVRGPRRTDQTLVQTLLARKVDILALLREQERIHDHERFEERAAIAEYEGGLSRQAAEQLARQELNLQPLLDR